MGQGFESSLARLEEKTIEEEVSTTVVSVAQLAEHRIVDPRVEGSNPFTHPILGWAPERRPTRPGR